MLHMLFHGAELHRWTKKYSKYENPEWYSCNKVDIFPIWTAKLKPGNVFSLRKRFLWRIFQGKFSKCGPCAVSATVSHPVVQVHSDLYSSCTLRHTFLFHSRGVSVDTLVVFSLFPCSSAVCDGRWSLLVLVLTTQITLRHPFSDVHSPFFCFNCLMCTTDITISCFFLPVLVSVCEINTILSHFVAFGSLLNASHAFLSYL